MHWYLEYGGPILTILLLFSLVATAVGFYKFFQLRGALLEARSFFDGFLKELKRKQVRRALKYCRASDSVFSTICRIGVKHIGKDRETIRTVMEDEASIEMKPYKKGLGLLSTIAHVSPLLGLLGTVIGMILAFRNVQQTSGMEAGGVDPRGLSGGIWQALLTTAAGLIVAIGVYLLYRYLESLRESLFETVERKSITALHLLDQLTPKSKSREDGSGSEETQEKGRKELQKEEEGAHAN